MSTVIYKYVLQYSDFCPVQLPKGSRILATDIQAGHPTIWAQVPVSSLESKESEDFIFSVVETGHVVPEDTEYLDSMQDGSFVWHIFYRKVE